MVYYLHGQWKAVFVVLFSILMGSVISLAGPWIWGILLIDGVISKSDLYLLPVAIGLLVAAAVGDNAFSYTQTYWAQVISQRIIYRLRMQLFVHLESLSLRFYDSHRTGELISRVTNDVNVLQDSISSMITDLVPDMLLIAGTVLLLVIFDFRTTLLVAATFPGTVLIATFFRRRVRRASRKVQEAVGAVASKVHDMISGILIIQAFTKEEHEAERFKMVANETLDASLVSQKLSSSYASFVGLLSASGFVITAAVYAPAIVAHDKTIGLMWTYLGYLALLRSPLRGLSKFHYTWEKGRGASERIFEVLDSKADLEDAKDAVELPPLRGEVEFRDVTFGYKEAPVLRNLSLHVRAGRRVALVGPSGVGKTTLVNLLLRFYDPWSGSVAVDGFDLRRVKLQSLRRQIGFVPQDCYLFSGTVFENIAYGVPEATDEDVKASARAANAHDFITNLPRGYDTEVGERGLNLSLGQRQRIAIARAILKSPTILVLDEATSNLDSISENMIEQALETAFEGRTVFIIAHRLATVVNADTIVVLWDGAVAEVGTHADLLERGGLYANLFHTQVSSLLEGHARQSYETVREEA
jgi:subfamily B ATP-binding cassette protein MsbA